MTELARHLTHDPDYVTMAYAMVHGEPAEHEMVFPTRLMRSASRAYPSVSAPTAHLAHSVLLTQGDSGSPAELDARADSSPDSDVPGQRPAADSPEGART
jgi:hypothetical protein